MREVVHFLLVFWIGFVGIPAVHAMEFTVVVNKSVKESVLTKTELKHILLTNTLTWGDGTLIKIVTLEAGSAEADALATEYMGMSSLQAKKLYLTKVFGGVIVAAPPTGTSVEEVVDLVAKTPGAIAILPRAPAAKQVKIVEIK